VTRFPCLYALLTGKLDAQRRLSDAIARAEAAKATYEAAWSRKDCRVVHHAEIALKAARAEQLRAEMEAGK